MTGGPFNRTLRRWSDALYWRLRDVIVPGLENSQFTYAQVLRPAVESKDTQRWLDVGCGHQLFPTWFSEHRQRSVPVWTCAAVGVDLDLAALRRHADFRLRAQGDIQALPFRDQTFDLVTSNMVLEHLERPVQFFSEVSRVLMVGGRFIAHTPNAEGYTTLLTHLIPRRFRSRAASLVQGRDPEDVYPTHYRANSDQVLRELAARSGLAVNSLTYVQSSPQMTLIPVLTLLEMLFIRLLFLEPFSRRRACLIVELEKRAPSAPDESRTALDGTTS